MNLPKILFYTFLFICSAFIGCNSKKQQTQTNKYSIPELNIATSEIDQNPKDPNRWINRAVIFSKNNMYNESVADIATAMKIDSMNVDYHHLLADVYLKMANSSLALITVERAEKLEPTNIKNLIKTARVYIILKQYDRGLNALNEAIRIDPLNAEAFQYIGISFKEMGDTTRAINAFQTATENDHEMIDAWLNLGQLYHAKKNPLAARYFDNALAIKPNDPIVMHMKADYLYQTNKIQESIGLYKSIIENHREYNEAYYNLGTIYYNLDSLDLALKHFKLLTTQDPLSYQGVYMQGVVYEAMGDLQAAYDQYLKSTKMVIGYEDGEKATKRLKAKLNIK
jgi:tetratricopeptide (TPR) repeat protein